MLTITPGTAHGRRIKLRNQRRPGNARLSSNALDSFRIFQGKVLDEYVIGQDRAKKILAVAVYNHYKRLQAKPGDKRHRADRKHRWAAAPAQVEPGRRSGDRVGARRDGDVRDHDAVDHVLVGPIHSTRPVHERYQNI